MPRIVIPKTILSTVKAEMDKSQPNETGGFLLGYRRGHDIEVVDLTLSAPGDLSTRTSFIRNSIHHERTIKSRWASSQGFVSLVGDWHSHPVGLATPSATDRNAWRQLSRAVKGNVSSIIISPNETSVYFTKRARVCSYSVLATSIEDTEESIVFSAS